MSFRNVFTPSTGIDATHIRESGGDFIVRGTLDVRGSVVNEELTAKLAELTSRLSNLQTGTDLEDLDQQSQINVLASNQQTLKEIVSVLWDAVSPH